MIEYIIGGAILLIGAVGKAISGSSNDNISSLGQGMEKFKDSAVDKANQAAEAKERAEAMSDSQLKANLTSGNLIQRAACQNEYKKRNS